MVLLSLSVIVCTKSERGHFAQEVGHLLPAKARRRHYADLFEKLPLEEEYRAEQEKLTNSKRP